MKRREIFLVLLIILIYLCFTIPPLISTKYLTGPDSPFYLLQMRNIKNGEIYNVFNSYPDRILTILTQSLVPILVNVDLIFSLKLWIGSIVVLQAITYFLMVKVMFNKEIAYISVFVLSMLAAFYRLVWDLYANFFAIVLFNVVILMYFLNSKKYSKFKYYFLALFLGLIMYTHNLSAVTFVFLIFLPFTFIWSFYSNLFKKEPILKIIKRLLYFILFWVLISLLSLKSWFFPVVRGVVGVISNKLFGSNYVVGSAWTTEIYTPNMGSGGFPYNTTAFSKQLQINYLIISLLGLFALLFKKKKKKSEFFVIWWTIVLMVLTQQQLFGFHWIPDRNVLLLAWPLSILIAYLIVNVNKCLRNLVKNKTIIRVIMSIIMAVFISGSLRKLPSSVILRNPNNTIEQEFRFLERVNSYIDENSVIITSNIRHYWSEYLIDKAIIEPGEYYLICGNHKLKERLGKKWIDHSLYLSRETDARSVYEMAINEQRLSGKKIYFIISPNDNCVDDDKFSQSKYFNLIYENHLRLYSLNSDNRNTEI